MYMSTEELITEMSMSYSYSMHLVVEGETDQKFFCSVFNSHACVNIICAPGTGSEGVIEIVQKVDIENSKNNRKIDALGIIDRDYRIPLETIPNNSNILLTDLRDLECMMFASPCLGHVLNELGSLVKLKNAGGETSIRTTIVAACKPVAELRYHSHLAKLHLNFQKLNYEKFVDKKTLTVDEGRLIAHIAGGQVEDPKKIDNKTAVEAKRSCASAKESSGSKYFTDDLLLCRGHDLMTVIALGLRSAWGSKSASEASVSLVEGHFRVAFVQHFKLTKLFTNILAWLKSRGLDRKVGFA